MTLQIIRTMALRRFGFDGTIEDELFSYAKMNQIVNEKHQWLSGIARPYYDEFTVDLPATGIVPLDDSVIEADLKTVAWLDGATWKSLLPRSLGSMIETMGPLQSVAAGTPAYYHTKTGSKGTADSRVIRVVPKPTGGLIAAGFYYGAWTMPDDLTDDAHSPNFAVSQHHRLISCVCWGMAELARAHGRENSPVDYWLQRAVEDADQLEAFYRNGMRELPRSTTPSATALEDAQRRATAHLPGGNQVR